jgi:hypothetical protein
MKTDRMKKGSAACWKALAAIFAAIPVSSAVAQTIDHPDYYTAPAAHTWAGTGSGSCTESGCTSPDQANFDGQILGELGDPLPRWTTSSLWGSSAYAEASKNRFAARAYSTNVVGCGPGCTTARGFAHWLFVAHDPEGRGEVTLRLKAKGYASAAGLDSSGFLSVTVCVPSGPGTLYYDATGVLVAKSPPCALGDPPYQASGRVFVDWRRPSGDATKTIAVFGVPTVVEEISTGVDMRIDDGIAVIPGLPYMITVVAGANAGVDGAVASVVDPILEPDSVNPDVTIEFPGLADDPDPPSLMGEITPEALQAVGLDPQPFADLGFFDTTSGNPPASEPPPPPSADTTPPATSASPTPGANAQGWSNVPVTVALAATDNAGGSGVKEVHYALAGAATASQVVSGGSANVTIAAEGTTTLTYFAVDNAGNQEAAKTLTVRIDQTPPTVIGLPSNCSLWPPDHRLVQVASASASDALSGTTGAPVVKATSNEPEAGTDGDLAPDVVISNGTVQLRAERAGNGTGRVYTIIATAADLAGNTVTQTATCRVPHDM